MQNFKNLSRSCSEIKKTKSDLDRNKIDGIIENLNDYNYMFIQVKNNQNEKIEILKSQLYTNKLFLSMVIHDLRNPTSCIKNGLIQSQTYLKKI